MFPDILFLMTKKIKSLLSLEKKEAFACVIFGKICYVACVINHAGKLICLRACLHMRNRVGLIDKPNPLTTSYPQKGLNLLS